MIEENPKRSVIDLNVNECRIAYEMAFDNEPDEEFYTRVVPLGNGEHSIRRIGDFERLLQLYPYGGVYAMVEDTHTPEIVNAPRLVSYLLSIGVVFKLPE